MNFDNRPPLPEPVQSPSEEVRGERPPELDIAVGLLALLALVGLWLLDPKVAGATSGALSAAEVAATRTGMWSVTALYLVVLWFFWRGANWARVAILILSALSLFNVFAVMAYPNWMARIFLLLDAVVCAYFLFWLTRPPVVAYFKGNKSAS